MEQQQAITTSDVHRIYEERAIDLDESEASAIADRMNARGLSRDASLAALRDKADAERERWEDLCDMRMGNSFDYEQI